MATAVRTRIDPVTARVVGGRLESICDEMAHKLARMSYSSIIRESEDFGCALLDAKGQQLAESLMSTPLQSGPIPGYVQGILGRLGEMGQEMGEGDVVMHNHPYYGASHGPDVAFCVPVFHRDELIGYSVTTAHHLDVGALSPGSCGIVNAQDAYAEGLQVNAVKVYEAGKRNEWVWSLLESNIRSAPMVLGDMEAQIAAARVGAERYVELVEKMGLDVVRMAGEDLLDYSERMLREKIAQVPDGKYRAEGYMDGFLDDPDPTYRGLKLAVEVEVKGDDIIVDLSGTAPQVDRPVNMPFIGTVDIAIYVVLRSVLLDSATHEHVPANSGLYRPIEIRAPLGSLANPRYPAPVIARFAGGNVVADCVQQALADVLPSQVSAGVGKLKVVAWSGLDEDGQYWLHMDIIEGSYGGRFGKDGLDAVDTLYANTRNNPIEDIETHTPLRVDRYELREEGAGAGKWRGGYGSIRDVRFVRDGGFSMEGDGNAFPSPGLFGGAPGAVGACILNPEKEDTSPLPTMSPYRKIRVGDTIRLIGPCGGGYGDPFERTPSEVLEDVLDELISVEGAREDYGVVIDTDIWQVDEPTTHQLRLRKGKGSGSLEGRKAEGILGRG